MTEPRTSKRRVRRKRGANTEEKSCETDFYRVLMEWKYFKDVENIVKPYVSEVINKTVYGGYESARQVLDDYKIFNSLRTKLTEGKDELLVETYAAEVFYHHALQRKAEMLGSFSTMLTDAAVEDEHLQWIIDQLKEDVPYELSMFAVDCISYWDEIVNELDKDVQTKISIQKMRRLKFLEKIHHNESGFQADNFVQRKKEFEELNSEISSTEKLLDELSERSACYYETLRDVGDESTLGELRKQFVKLLRDDEEDLVTSWLEETNVMEELVQKDKEEMKKARDVCDVSWYQATGILP